MKLIRFEKYDFKVKFYDYYVGTVYKLIQLFRTNQQENYKVNEFWIHFVRVDKLKLVSM